MVDPKTEEAKRLFAARLKAKLKEHHMDQNTLAKLLGMSESSIGKWTLEKSMPRTMGQIEKIASIFGVEKGYFLDENWQAQDNRDIQRLDPASAILDDRDIRLLVRERLKGASEEEVALKKRQLKAMIAVMWMKEETE